MTRVFDLSQPIARKVELGIQGPFVIAAIVFVVIALLGPALLRPVRELTGARLDPYT